MVARVGKLQTEHGPVNQCCLCRPAGNTRVWGRAGSNRLCVCKEVLVCSNEGKQRRQWWRAQHGVFLSPYTCVTALHALGGTALLLLLVSKVNQSALWTDIVWVDRHSVSSPLPSLKMLFALPSCTSCRISYALGWHKLSNHFHCKLRAEGLHGTVAQMQATTDASVLDVQP